MNSAKNLSSSERKLKSNVLAKYRLFQEALTKLYRLSQSKYTAIIWFTCYENWWS